jgi:hypothetical protein
MNPLRDLFDYMAKASGAHALFTAGLLMAVFGTVALVARPDPTPVLLLLGGVMAVSGLMALGYGLGAWEAASDRDDSVRQRRMRLGLRWLAASAAALLLALLSTR